MKTQQESQSELTLFLQNVGDSDVSNPAFEMPFEFTLNGMTWADALEWWKIRDGKLWEKDVLTGEWSKHESERVSPKGLARNCRPFRKHKVVVFLRQGFVPRGKVPKGQIKYEIDHADRDRDNNNSSNLHIVTKKANMMNQSPRMKMEWRADEPFAKCEGQSDPKDVLGELFEQADVRYCFDRIMKGERFEYPIVELREYFRWGVGKEGLEMWRRSRGKKGGWEKARLYNRDGYLVVTYKGKHLFAHHLVYALERGFILAMYPKGALVLHHKDSDRGNFHISNLEYVTLSENGGDGVMSAATGGGRSSAGHAMHRRNGTGKFSAEFKQMDTEKSRRKRWAKRSAEFVEARASGDIKELISVARKWRKNSLRRGQKKSSISRAQIWQRRLYLIGKYGRPVS